MLAADGCIAPPLCACHAKIVANAWLEGTCSEIYPHVPQTIILLMLFINDGVGFWQEFKADNAIALLKERLALKARIKRDGVWKEIEAKLLVPGDFVHVKLGNFVPAYLKLIAFKRAINARRLP